MRRSSPIRCISFQFNLSVEPLVNIFIPYIKNHETNVIKLIILWESLYENIRERIFETFVEVVRKNLWQNRFFISILDGFHSNMVGSWSNPGPRIQKIFTDPDQQLTRTISFISAKLKIIEICKFNTIWKITRQRTLYKKKEFDIGNGFALNYVKSLGVIGVILRNYAWIRMKETQYVKLLGEELWIKEIID